MTALGPVPDVMTALLESELESILRQIFLLLDPSSLKAARQVSSQWNSFILDRSGKVEHETSYKQSVPASNPIYVTLKLKKKGKFQL